MRGRRPLPEALTKLHGNPGKRREKKIPRARVGVPDAPDHLRKIPIALEEWNRVVPLLVAMRVLSHSDRACLAAYCTHYARHVRAEEQIARWETELVLTPNHSMQQSPWVSISNRASELMHKFMVELGLTPSSRVRLGQPVESAQPVLPDAAEAAAQSLHDYLEEGRALQ